MNTNPDETKLALWLDDELTGEELATFEASFGNQPEHLAAREEVRRWRKMMREAMPASEEPPHAEFFSARIARSIREEVQAVESEPAAAQKKRLSWQGWWMPLAACAGMAFAFFAGQRVQPGPPEIDVAGAPKAIPVEPIVYTPDGDVAAEWFASSEASATVIVLSGVDAIPDAMDFSETAAVPTEREIDSTAGNEPEGIDPAGL
ncbi:MAG: hypothetical protein MUF13_09045 [Akkermansiaceae bacterium]|nr:hypothetical protein [Akkermansiaceae bacterium]